MTGVRLINPNKTNSQNNTEVFLTESDRELIYLREKLLLNEVEVFLTMKDRLDTIARVCRPIPREVIDKIVDRLELGEEPPMKEESSIKSSNSDVFMSSSEEPNIFVSNMNCTDLNSFNSQAELEDASMLGLLND